MSTYRAKNLWTAFITAFFALLAALGLAGSTASATEATVTEPHGHDPQAHGCDRGNREHPVGAMDPSA